MDTFFDGIDWPMLREQKFALLGVLNAAQDALVNGDSPLDATEVLALTGILNLLDAMQDHAVDELGVPETEVFRLDVEEDA